MADETIRIPLEIPSSFWQEADQRFDLMARNAAQKFAQAMRVGGAGGGAGAPGSGAAGNVPGGGGGSMRSEVMKATGDFGGGAAALFDVAASTFQGAREGIRNTRGAAASSGKVLADNAITGGLSSFVENTVGKIPILGDVLVAQMNAAKDAIDIPRDRATAQVQGMLGNLVRAGYDASDEEVKAALDYSNEIQQSGYNFEQRVDRMNREAHPTSAAFGLNWNGSG